MGGTSEALFTAANEQYQAALKWRTLTILVLAFLQFFIVKPYVELGRAKEKAEAELNAGTDEARAAADLTQRLERERKRIEDRVGERTAAVREALVCGFDELNQAVRIARGEAPPPRPASVLPPQAQMNLAAPGRLSNLAAPSPVQAPLDLQRTMPGQISAGCTPAAALPEFDAAQLETARRAQSADDLAEGLRPYIERYVVLPPLQAFNAAWRDEEAPPLIAALGEIRAAIAAQPKPRPGGTGPDAVWRALEAAPGQIETALRGISIPESAAGGDWWRTTTGKGARMELVGASASSGVAAALGPVNEAERRLGAILEAQKQGLAAIEAALKEKSAELAALRESLAGSLSPVKWFALELDDVAPQFTLLLGFVLALAVAWPAARLAELTAIARAGLRLEPEGAASFWLAARQARAMPLAPAAAAAALGLALVAWIVLTAWQLSGAGATLQAGLAIAAVVAACLYHAWVQRDLARLIASAGDKR